MLQVIAKSVARDGEALVRVVRDRKLPYGISVQMLEADRLDERINMRLADGGVIRMGVEMDSALRPVAYHLIQSHPGDPYSPGRAQSERVPVKDLYHVYLPERAEQVRGYSWLHAVILRAANASGYEEAAIVAARIGASKMGIFTKAADSAATLAGIADEKSEGNFQMSAQPGEFMELPIGYDLKSWDPEYPHANFESFMKQCMRGLAAGLDVATHNLSGDMTEVNYSSARIAELAEREVWMMLQEWLHGALVKPLYDDWLASALLRGDITFPSGSALSSKTYQKFTSTARFQGRRWSWVDPKNDVETARQQIAEGLNSRTRIAAAMGMEFEDIIDELGQEKAMMDAAGIAPAPKPAAAPGSTPAAAPPPAEAAGTAKAQPINVPVNVSIQKGAIQLDHRAGDTHITVPERSVQLDAHMPEVHVQNNVPPAQVVVNNPTTRK
jgi:lambda family phage portal protein